MRRKPRLTRAQREARLEWAKIYAQKPAKFWDTVIFSDETSIHVHEAIRGKFVWRMPNEDLLPGMVQETVKFGGSKLHIWGCLTSQGVGYHCGLPDGLDSETYVGILKDESLSAPSNGTLKTEMWWCSSRTTLQPIRQESSRSTSKIKSTPSSPGQPIPRTALQSKTSGLTSRTAWWSGTPRSRRKTSGRWWTRSGRRHRLRPVPPLLHSMPERLAAVIRAGGGYTKY